MTAENRFNDILPENLNHLIRRDKLDLLVKNSNATLIITANVMVAILNIVVLKPHIALSQLSTWLALAKVVKYCVVLNAVELRLTLL